MLVETHQVTMLDHNADGNGIIYNFPSLNLSGADVSIGLEYSLDAGTDTASNGAGVAKADGKGSAWGLGVTTAYEGFTVGAYASKGENEAAAKSDEFTGSAFYKLQHGSSISWLSENSR
jgi:hypothetical protein